MKMEILSHLLFETLDRTHGALAVSRSNALLSLPLFADRTLLSLSLSLNALVAKAQKVPEVGWTMQDGTIWPGNNVRDHPGMIQVFLGQSGGHDMDGNELPRLVYVSREKRPGFNHHKKAGAMNALVRVSAVLTNAPYMLNLDCDHYFNNSKAIREAMCFMMDPLVGKKMCSVQFPQRFDGIDRHDRYANRNIVFFDINMKGLDGIQGPIYVGTGCAFQRQALYGYDVPKTKKPPTRTCNCWPKWCCFSCCCSGRTKKKKNVKTKYEKKIKTSRRGENGAPAFALEGIEEGIEGVESANTAIMSDVNSQLLSSPHNQFAIPRLQPTAFSFCPVLEICCCREFQSVSAAV